MQRRVIKVTSAVSTVANVAKIWSLGRQEAEKPASGLKNKTTGGTGGFKWQCNAN